MHVKYGDLRRLMRLAPICLFACLFAAVAWLALAGESRAERSAQGGTSNPPDDPARGLIYEGLVPNSGGCGSLFHVSGTSACTHGPDAAPTGIDVRVHAVQPAPSRPTAPAVQCEGDGVAGKRTHVLYVRASGTSDRYADYLSSFQQWAVDADLVYLESAAETGGMRRIRFVHDGACVPVVGSVTVPATGTATFGAMINSLSALGYNRSDRKYLVFVDAVVYCGIATINENDSPGSGNSNNGGPSYARVDSGCWGGGAAAHEHMHNLGGVQLSAPHSSGGFHCVDEYDRMCYSDHPNYPPMQFLCNSFQHETLFDCNHDDYFHTEPLPGSYLATKWNAANSAYLMSNASCVPLAIIVSPPGAGAVQALPAPDCNAGSEYTPGTQVSLTVTANGGYAFVGWTGDASGSAANVTLNVDGRREVIAFFDSLQPGAVGATQAWTADRNGSPQSVFSPLQPLRYYGAVQNSSGSVQPVLLEWLIGGPCGQMPGYSGYNDTGIGTWYWYLTSTAAGESCAGRYVQQLSVTHNGQVTTASSVFTVSGSIRFFLPSIRR